MPKLPGINHQHAVRVLEKARFRIIRHGKHIVMSDGARILTIPRHIAYCAEIPGANGQGKTKEECLKSLAEAIELILEDKRQDSLRGISEDAVAELVAVE